MKLKENEMKIDASMIVAVTGLVIAIGGVVGTYISTKLAARKNELDTVTTRLQANIDAVDKDNARLRSRLDEVESDNTELRALLREFEKERSSNLRRIEVLECQVADLEAQLVALGQTPVTRKGSC